MYYYLGILKIIQYCLVVLICYPIVHTILSLTNSQYNKLSYNKKCYVFKNIIKSVSLSLISISGTKNIIIPVIYGENYVNPLMYETAAQYVSNDIIGLFLIPKLPRTTIFHHITTTLLVITSFSIDFTHDNVGRWMFIYTMWSCFSFGVNAYLGLRFLITDKTNFFNVFVDVLRIISFYKYLIFCIINWSWHVILVYQKIIINDLSVGHYLYLIFLIPIVRDDIILMSWLYNKSR